MARRSFGKVQPLPKKAAPAPQATDSFANFEARVGIEAANQASKGHYTFELGQPATGSRWRPHTGRPGSAAWPWTPWPRT